MHSRTSSIMPRTYYPSSLVVCGSHNPGLKSTVGCVRTRSYTHLGRELNRSTSQDREGLGRRWILFRIPCARRSQRGERVVLLPLATTPETWPLTQDALIQKEFALKTIRCPTGAEGVEEAMREVAAHRRFKCVLYDLLFAPPLLTRVSGTLTSSDYM